MINNETMQHHDCAVHPFKRICWSAILAGSLVGLGLGFLLNLFSMTIGLSVFSVDKVGAIVIAYGGVIGLFIGVLVSMFIAGYTSGYLGRKLCPRRNLGILYGFMTWTAILLLSGFVFTQVTQYVSGYSKTVVGPRIVLSVDDQATHSTVKVDKKNNEGSDTIKVMASSQDLAVSSFITFVLFFLGAAATCWGAAMGMCCKRDE